MKWTPALASLVILWGSCAAGDTTTDELLAQSDPVAQQSLANLFDAFKPGRDSEALQQIETLKEAAGDDGVGGLAEQVAIFATTAQGEPGIVGMRALFVMHRLDLKSSVIIRSFSLYLGSENKRLREFVLEWFQMHDGEPEDPFDEYADYLCGMVYERREPPSEFVEYLFEQSPGRALLAFNRVAQYGKTMNQMKKMHEAREAEVAERRKRGESIPTFKPAKPFLDRVFPQLAFEEIRKIRLAEHLVSHAVWLKDKRFEGRFSEAATADAREQLERLSTHDEWWARLYAAEIMRRHRDLRLPEAVEKLREDSNELVSKAAKSVP